MAREKACAIGLHLKRAATEKGISQRRICELSGLKPTSVNRVLNGKHPANSELLVAIADAIGVTIEVNNETK